MRSDLFPTISSTQVGSLATVNEDGSPWNTPLHMAFADEYVVWLSPERSQHSQNIARDPRVSITLWSSENFENVKGVYLQSTAKLVTGTAEMAARQVYVARFGTNIPDQIASSETYIAAIGDINTTKTRGGRLYFDG